MAYQPLKTVRLVANANNRSLRTVGLVSSASGYLPNQLEQVYQGPDAANSIYETVQGVTGPVAGLATCINLGTEGGGGGGGVPVWVLNNAKIDIDLVNNRAWTATSGVVAIDTLLGADPNSSGGWSTTEYDPGGLTVNGYNYLNDPPALIGSARTMALAGATVRALSYQHDEVGGDGFDFVFVSTDGHDAIEVSLEGGQGLGDAYSWGGSLSISTDVTLIESQGALSVIAFTLVGSRIEIALNGSTAVAGVVGSNDRPAGNPFTAVIADDVLSLQRLTIYDPLPSTAGLSALSEV